MTASQPTLASAIFRTLACVFALAFCLSSQASYVVVPPVYLNGSPSKQPVTITNLIRTPLLGTNRIYSVDYVKDAAPTNIYQGVSNCAVFVLPESSYRCDIGPYSGNRGQLFNVPDDTNTYWISELATNANTIGSLSSFWLNTNNVFGGSNILVQTTSTGLVINATGGGGGADYNLGHLSFRTNGVYTEILFTGPQTSESVTNKVIGRATALDWYLDNDVIAGAIMAVSYRDPDGTIMLHGVTNTTTLMHGANFIKINRPLSGSQPVAMEFWPSADEDEFGDPIYAGHFEIGTNAVFSALGGAKFSGNGSGLTDLNASQLTTGTVPNAALTNSYLGEFAEIRAEGPFGGVQFTNTVTVRNFNFQLYGPGFGVSTNLGHITNLNAGIFLVDWLVAQSFGNYGLSVQQVVTNGVLCGLPGSAYLQDGRASLSIRQRVFLPANTVLAVTNLSLPTPIMTNNRVSFSVERIQ